MMVFHVFQWFLLGLAPWCSIYFHITNFLCASDVTYFKKWQVAFFFGGDSSDQFSLKTIGVRQFLGLVWMISRRLPRACLGFDGYSMYWIYIYKLAVWYE